MRKAEGFNDKLRTGSLFEAEKYQGSIGSVLACLASKGCFYLHSSLSQRESNRKDRKDFGCFGCYRKKIHGPPLRTMRFSAKE